MDDIKVGDCDTKRIKEDNENPIYIENGNNKPNQDNNNNLDKTKNNF